MRLAWDRTPGERERECNRNANPDNLNLCPLHQSMNDPQTNPAPVTLGTAFWYWLKLGFISFGGPAGQIAMMHAELVEKRRWISERRFLHALNYCMVLPGPEATQLAIYIGWLMHRSVGGIIAGVLFGASAGVRCKTLG